MVNADNLRDANPWHPMNNPIDLKTIGKAIEELGECASALARAMIQGIDEKEPATGKVNRQWVEDEMADVEANFILLKERFDLHLSEVRIVRKLRHLRQWHSMA